MRAWTAKAIALAAAVMIQPWLAGAASPAKLSGGIAGVVKNAAGVPQMGALVILYNRSDRPVQRTYTNEKGEFAFASLMPDVYSIRVTLASFLPALKRNIAVQPGMQSLLQVNLASVFSSIELLSTAPGPVSVISEEWKWVLRGADDTRPVLRFVPDIRPAPERKTSVQAFSRPRGVLKVSGGDEGSVTALGAEPDLGTAFALATTLFGANHLQFAGNFGYSVDTSSPAAAFRTSFRRELPGGASPQLGVTMRQLGLPVRAAAGQAMLAAQRSGFPALRTLSVTMYDRKAVSARLAVEYGSTLDSVAFFDRLNYLSPFTRVSYDGRRKGTFQFSYVSGVPPAELLSASLDNAAEFEQDLALLALFPRLSLRDGRARVQRSASYEAGYRLRTGSRTFSVATYSEALANAAVVLAAPEGLVSGSDLLPDLFSRGWVLNAGSLRRAGFTAGVSQALGGTFELSIAYSNGRTLSATRQDLERGDSEELRSILRPGRRHALTARIAGTAPGTGTRFVTSYQWASAQSALPPHAYLTQPLREGLGWNVLVRQPMPSFG
ncbi:MAG: carboxypeptidase-like regulatory domain-containing protein, partial [Bryobacteraceae bacterium]